jgi:IclR family pca regulon transcriptional regulator
MKEFSEERDPAAGGPDYPYFSKVIEKGLRILNLFSPVSPSLSLKDITSKTGINPASTFRFVETLIQLGYLKKDPRTKLIKLGPMALAFSHNVIASFDLLQIIKPFIDEAFENFNVTIDSGVIEDDRPVILYRREAKDTLVFKMPVAAAGIMHCTALTKAILAWLPEDSLSRALDSMTFIRRTPHTLTSPAALRTDLLKTRERGYSINNEEFVVGLISLGAPLIARDGTVIGAVSFDVSTVQYAVEEAEKRFTPALLRLVQDIRPMLPQ